MGWEGRAGHRIVAGGGGGSKAPSAGGKRHSPDIYLPKPSDADKVLRIFSWRDNKPDSELSMASVRGRCSHQCCTASLGGSAPSFTSSCDTSLLASGSPSLTRSGIVPCRPLGIALRLRSWAPNLADNKTPSLTRLLYECGQERASGRGILTGVELKIGPSTLTHLSD